MKVIDRATGKIYDSIAQACRETHQLWHERTIQKKIKQNGYCGDLILYSSTLANNATVSKENLQPKHRIEDHYTEAEIDNLIELKKAAGDVEVFKITPHKDSRSKKVGVVLASDWHVEEVVTKSSTMGLNSFDEKIARTRISNFFERLVKMVDRNPCDELILALEGDFISGFIHSELQENNSMTPMQGISLVKGALISGIEYVATNLKMNITIPCICGNHGRTTKKVQYANGWAQSYEFFMYCDLRDYFAQNEKIKFIVPEAEMTILDIVGYRVLFAHGNQFRTAGGIGGIYPSMFRWFHKVSGTYNIDLAAIGHWHTSTITKKVITNGSLKGFDQYAMSHGLDYERAQQTFFMLEEKRGVVFWSPIDCE